MNKPDPQLEHRLRISKSENGGNGATKATCQTPEATAMKIGAQYLWEAYHGAKIAIAEAYVKGDISRLDEQFIWDVIDVEDVIEARSRLPKTTWRLLERVAELEREVAELRTENRDDSI